MENLLSQEFVKPTPSHVPTVPKVPSLDFVKIKFPEIVEPQDTTTELMEPAYVTPETILTDTLEEILPSTTTTTTTTTEIEVLDKIETGAATTTTIADNSDLLDDALPPVTQSVDVAIQEVLPATQNIQNVAPAIQNVADNDAIEEELPTLPIQ